MSSTSTNALDALHATASRKAMLRLLPILCLIYFMAFIDRTNVGLAKTALDADVGIGAAAYGLGAGIFFLSYALLEVPSNMVMHRVGPRAWIGRIAVTWGAVSVAMMFVQGEKSFYVLRVLLGAAEAGLYPALMYMVTLWFAQHQRAQVVGFIYLAVCTAMILGGPIGGALMELGSADGLYGWQWMFLIEGLATVAIGIYIWRRLPGRPSEAPWLTTEEAAVLEERAAAQDAPDHASLRGNWKTAFGRPFILLLALVYFVNQVTSVAIQYNFPSIVEDLDVNGSFLIGVVSGSIGIGAFIGVLVMPWLHARMQDETRMILVCTIATAVVATTYAFVDGAVARVLLIVLAMLFLVGVLPLYWSVAMARMSGLMAAAGLAFINTVGLLGGFVGPYLYGFAEDAVDAAAGFAVLIAFAVAGIFLIPLLRRAVRAEDRRTAEPVAEGVPTPTGVVGSDRR